ncbi:MAG: M1 family metallopeptidase [Anaerolineae bacterium]|nr:M1 family metallopeptidase [Anaerolineae bacterium]
MRKLWILIVILVSGMVVQAQEPGSAGIGDPYYPTLGNGGYDALSYALDLDVDMENNVISGSSTMEAEATEDLSSFHLDFIGFEIESIEVNGEAAAYLRNGRELSITPEAALEDGESFTVVVAYTGEPNEDLSQQSALYSSGWVRYKDGVFVASEPAGAARWFPVNDHPRDKALYSFRITVPEPYVVAANGLLQDVIINADDTTTYVWSSEYVMASYLATVNIGDFVVQTDEGPDGLLIRNYFPSRLTEDAEEVFAPTADMIEYFSSIFGPYPFEAYGVVVADLPLFFALETQTLSLFGAEMIPGALTDILSGWQSPESVIAHELSHQWFGDSVTPENWEDIWLNEGFASYASALWLEHSAGEAVFENVMRQYYAQIEGRNYTPGDPGPNRLFGQGIYPQGAWTLHALRMEVGDETFFEILRTYYERYQYSNASTADFIQVAEEVSGQDLTDFFDAWLFDGGAPSVPSWGLGIDDEED